MKYLLSSQIAKRCPKGHWADLETGECIPKEEWERRYRNQESEHKCPPGKIWDKDLGKCVKDSEYKRSHWGKKDEEKKEKYCK